MSKRTPKPSGAISSVIRPGEGRNLPPAGSSALMRTSMAWPRRDASTSAWVIGSGSPDATLICHSTRSMPVITSVTGCSTCSRVFISRKKNSPSW